MFTKAQEMIVIIGKETKPINVAKKQIEIHHFLLYMD